MLNTTCMKNHRRQNHNKDRRELKAPWRNFNLKGFFYRQKKRSGSLSTHSVATRCLEMLKVPWRVLSSAFLRTVSGPEDENVQLAGGERALFCYYQKCSAQVGQKHIRILQSDYSTCKKQKILQVSEAWKVLEGILINVHKVVGLLNSSVKRKWDIRENEHQIWQYIGLKISVAAPWCSGAICWDFFFFFLTADNLRGFKEQPTTDRQTLPPFRIICGLRISFKMVRERKREIRRRKKLREISNIPLLWWILQRLPEPNCKVSDICL